MKITKEQAQKNREKIIDVASKKFRECGFDGIGVADLMREAGFTHGGFYGHFSSKEELMIAACLHAFEQSRTRWEKQGTGERALSLKKLASLYNKKIHRDSPGEGCPVPALAVDVSHQADELRTAFTENIKANIQMIADSITTCSKSEAKRKSIAAWSMLVGSMILARAVNDAKLSDQILDVGSEYAGEL